MSERKWCCRHRWTLGYIAGAVTVDLVISTYQLWAGWAL